MAYGPNVGFETIFQRDQIAAAECRKRPLAVGRG